MESRGIQTKSRKVNGKGIQYQLGIGMEKSWNFKGKVVNLIDYKLYCFIQLYILKIKTEVH